MKRDGVCRACPKLLNGNAATQQLNANENTETKTGTMKTQTRKHENAANRNAENAKRRKGKRERREAPVSAQ